MKRTRAKRQRYVRMLHIHLDPLGGVSGAMFAAALLDAFPMHAEGALLAARSITEIQCYLTPNHDGTVAGTWFGTDDTAPAPIRWHCIRSRIETSDLPGSVQQHAIGIVQALAEAEARVHGKQWDDIELAPAHLAAIVATAWAIDAIGPVAWSVGVLPVGSGPVDTVAYLLQSFSASDDGIPGERVTPCGAAILHYLGCGSRPAGALLDSGCGFGTGRLNGVSNCLHALVMEPAIDRRRPARLERDAIVAPGLR